MSETTKNCPNCGNEVRASATFCTKCGTRFGESASGETRVGASPTSTGPAPVSAGGGAHPDAGTGGAAAGAAMTGSPGPPQEHTSTPIEPPGGGPVGPKSMRMIGLVFATAVVGAVLAFVLTGGDGEDQVIESPTPTQEAAAATAEPTAEPADEFTPPPGSDVAARITDVTEEGGRYLVGFETAGFEPRLGGEDKHLHFFFDTVPASEAGVPGSGPWKIYPEQPGTVGESPFTGWAVSERPGRANQMCVLVANADHSVIPGTGNCFALP